MRIYCANAYSWFNKGDAALVIAHLDLLAKHFPDSEFVLMTDVPDDDKDKYPARTVAPPFVPWRGIHFKRFRERFNRLIGWRLPHRFQLTGRSRVWLWLSRNCLAWAQTAQMAVCLGKIWFFAAVLKRNPIGVFKGAARESAEALLASDAVIFVPGGYLMTFKPFETNWYRRIFPACLARSAGIPVILAPMSIGPFVGWRNRLLARITLNRVARIYLREEISAGYLRELNVPEEKFQITADAAFCLPRGTEDAERSAYLTEVQNSGGLKVGVSIRHYDFPAANDAEARLRRYIEDMAKFLDYIVEEHGASVWIMPQVMLPTGDNDLLISRRVIQTMQHSERARLVDDDLSPIQLQRLYSEMDVFVGVRMHANIFALSRNVPTLAIAYQKKTQGIMETLQLPEWVIDIYDLTYDRLRTKFENLLEKREEIRRLLPERIAPLRTKVDEAYKDMAEFCEGIPQERQQRVLDKKKFEGESGFVS